MEKKKCQERGEEGERDKGKEGKRRYQGTNNKFLNPFSVDMVFLPLSSQVKLFRVTRVDYEGVLNLKTVET